MDRLKQLYERRNKLERLSAAELRLVSRLRITALILKTTAEIIEILNQQIENLKKQIK